MGILRIVLFASAFLGLAGLVACRDKDEDEEGSAASGVARLKNRRPRKPQANR